MEVPASANASSPLDEAWSRVDTFLRTRLRPDLEAPVPDGDGAQGREPAIVQIGPEPGAEERIDAGPRFLERRGGACARGHFHLENPCSKARKRPPAAISPGGEQHHSIARAARSRTGP